MKKNLRSLVSLLCVLSVLVSLFLLPQTASAATATRVDMLDAVDATHCSNMNAWSSNAIVSSLTTLDGENAVKLTGNGTAWFPNQTDADKKDWTGQKALEIRVKNLKTDGTNKIIPIISNGNDHYVMNAGVKLELLWSNGIPEVTTVSGGRDVVLPAGFDGFIRIPVGNTGTDFGGFSATLPAINIANVTTISFHANVIAAADGVVFGKAWVLDEWTLPELPSKNTSADGKITYVDNYGNINSAQMAEITNNGASITWGITSLSKIKVGEDYFLHFKGPGNLYPPYPPAANWDWSDGKSLEIRIINNTAKDTLLSVFLDVTQSKTVATPEVHFCLTEGQTVYLVQNGRETEAAVDAGGYFTVPANFNGIAYFPLSVDGAEYGPVWSGAPSDWDLEKMGRVDFMVPGNADADLSVGRIGVRKDAYVPGQGNAPIPENEVKYIDYYDAMTPTQISDAINDSWGIAALEKTTINGKTYLNFKGPGNLYPPVFPVAEWNWTGYKGLQIGLVNNSPAASLLCIGLCVTESPGITDPNEPKSLKEGTAVYLVSDNGSVSVASADNNGNISIPGSFKGKIYLPFSNDGKDYTKMWPTAATNIAFDAKKISRISYHVPGNAGANFSVGEVALLGKAYEFITPVEEQDVHIDHFDSITPDQLSGAINDDWGIKFAELLSVDGVTSLHIKGPGNFYPPNLPLPEWDWKAFRGICINLTNNVSSEQNFCFGVGVAGGAADSTKSDMKALKEGTIVYLETSKGQKSTAVVDAAGNFPVPANFKGAAYLPFSADGKDFKQMWTNEELLIPWDAARLCRISYHVSGNPNADFTIGHVTLMRKSYTERGGTGEESRMVWIALLAVSLSCMALALYDKKRTA